MTTPSRLVRLHARLQQWADHGWANSVVFGWGLAQGCVFPGLADLFFLPLAVARPARAYLLAVVATAGTLLGSVTLYVLGHEALAVLEGPAPGVADRPVPTATPASHRPGTWTARSQ